LKIEDLFLDEQKLEQGSKLPLLLEDKEGNPLNEWVRLLYVHSDAAQSAMHTAMRGDFESGELTTDNKGSDRDLLKRYAYTLVIDWSFDNECTPENVKNLFAHVPEIRNSVIHYSDQKRLFFPSPGESSSPGQKKKSNS